MVLLRFSGAGLPQLSFCFLCPVSCVLSRPRQGAVLLFWHAAWTVPFVKTYRNLYPQVYDFENLYRAYRKARRGKRSKAPASAFERCQPKRS